MTKDGLEERIKEGTNAFSEKYDELHKDDPKYQLKKKIENTFTPFLVGLSLTVLGIIGINQLPYKTKDKFAEKIVELKQEQDSILKKKYISKEIHQPTQRSNNGL